MLLLELAVQAVRGFSPSTRVALKPGFVVLKSPTEAPAPIAGLLTALCFPDGKGQDAGFLAPGQRTGKAGFSFQANDNNVWRLVKELGGAGSLHKLNPATRQYEVVTQDANEVQQTMRAQVGFPPRATYEQLFTLTPSQFPTRREKTKSDAKAAQVKKKTSMDAAVEESRLKGLQKELVKARELGEVQYKLDGVTSDAYKLEARQKAFDDMKAQLDAARAELANAPTPERLGFPADIVDRVRRYPEEKKKHAEAVRRVMDEKEEAGLFGSASRVPPVITDTRFVAALIGGLVLLVLGGLTEGALHYTALLAIAPFTFAALLALRYIEELQGVARQGSKSDMYELRIKKVQDEFALYETQVNAAMEAVNAATRDEFAVAMAKPEDMKTKVAELEVQFAELQVDPENADISARLAAMKAEAEQLNQRLLEEAGGYARSEQEIMREIERAQEALDRARNPDGDFSGVPTAAAEHHDDPTPGLMVLGCDLFQCDMQTLWGQVRDRSVQYLTALADRRYHGAEIDKDGKAYLHAPGRKVPVTELIGKDVDLWYLSMRLTVAEKYSARSRLPVVIEDGLAGIVEDTKLPLLNRMLKHLGTLTQVLHVVGSARASEADEGQSFTV
jgi:hypothetical protein